MLDEAPSDDNYSVDPLNVSNIGDRSRKTKDGKKGQHDWLLSDDSQDD
jgi:hypothetical protein